jgi:predicted transposase YdaD
MKMNDHKPYYSRQELITLLDYVQHKAKEETKLQVAECMLDYGIDRKLVGAITGLTSNQLIKK